MVKIPNKKQNLIFVHFRYQLKLKADKTDLRALLHAGDFIYNPLMKLIVRFVRTTGALAAVQSISKQKSSANATYPACRIPPVTPTALIRDDNKCF